jgi:hypothetical protein
MTPSKSAVAAQNKNDVAGARETRLIVFPITRSRWKHEERCELPIHHQELGREAV